MEPEVSSPCQQLCRDPAESNPRHFFKVSFNEQVGLVVRLGTFIGGVVDSNLRRDTSFPDRPRGLLSL
jgi:hypothetical protein